MDSEQYHAGVRKLWDALNIITAQEQDVFTLAEKRIRHLTEVLESIANHGTDQPAASCDDEWHRRLAYRLIGIARRGLNE
jgi:hypothetical protein